MPAAFDSFFSAATGHEPYDYQRRLACGEPGRTACGEPSRTACGEPSRTARGEPSRTTCGERADGEIDAAWLPRGASCQSRLIDIPTGLGKTAAVVIAWL